MTELSPQAKALLRKAARGGGPTDDQRRALKGTLMSAVFGPAVAGAATAKVVLTGLLVAAVGAGAITAVGLRSQSALPPAAVGQLDEAAPPSAPPPVAAVIGEPVPVPPSDPPPRQATTPIPIRQPEVEPRPPVIREARGLALEIATLDRAVRAVDSGRFSEGLEAARGLLRDAPASQVAAEARVVEVLALCGLLRFEEAQVVSMSLSAADEGNPALRRLDNSCVERLSP